MSFFELRMNLANARIQLRSAKAEHGLLEAELEQEIAEWLGKELGANKEERERRLKLELSANTRYGYSIDALARFEDQADRCQAALDAALDEQKERTIQVRTELIDLLRERNIHVGLRESPEGVMTETAGDKSILRSVNKALDDDRKKYNMPNIHAGDFRVKPAWEQDAEDLFV